MKSPVISIKREERNIRLSRPLQFSRNAPNRPKISLREKGRHQNTVDEKVWLKQEIEDNFSKLCNVTINKNNRNYLQIERIDMEETLKSDDYIERLFCQKQKGITTVLLNSNLSDEEKRALTLEEQEHINKVFKIRQNISFIAKVIPAFVYRFYSKFGLEEMQDLLQEKIMSFTITQLKELAFIMYSCVNDPEKQTNLQNFSDLGNVKFDQGVCDKVNLRHSKPITEGMLYKLIESPVYLLLQNDISTMVKYLKGGDEYNILDQVDSEASSPTMSLIREQMMANTKQASIPNKIIPNMMNKVHFK